MNHFNCLNHNLFEKKKQFNKKKQCNVKNFIFLINNN